MAFTCIRCTADTDNDDDICERCVAETRSLGPVPLDFDANRCQWCGDTGFDLEGLAHHLWSRCEVVERLAQENIESCRRSHERCRKIAMRRLGLTDEPPPQPNPQ